MNVLRFRRDRRQRDPFAGPTAPAAPPVPCGWNAAGWPLVRDAVGVRPATGGEMVAPHGIATPETLADLVRQAEAEARPPWQPAPEPQDGPDLLAQQAHDWYGWNITRPDYPAPHNGRPYIPGVLGAEGRMSPRSAGVSEDLASLVLFRASVERMVRPCCADCQQATGTWQERLYGTFKHHTWAVPEAGPREFGIATELRQAHGETGTDADDAEAAFARRYLTRRAA